MLLHNSSVQNYILSNIYIFIPIHAFDNISKRKYSLKPKKVSRRNIYHFIYIYIYIFLLLPPIESSTGHLARTTNHQTRFTLNKQKCREETRNTAIALSHL